MTDDDLSSRCRLADVNFSSLHGCLQVMLLAADVGCSLRYLLMMLLTADSLCMRPMLLLDVCSACRWVWDETMPWIFNSEGGVVVIKSL